MFYYFVVDSFFFLLFFFFFSPSFFVSFFIFLNLISLSIYLILDGSIQFLHCNRTHHWTGYIRHKKQIYQVSRKNHHIFSCCIYLSSFSYICLSRCLKKNHVRMYKTTGNSKFGSQSHLPFWNGVTSNIWCK